MRYGICCGFDMIQQVESYGYDYLESYASSVAAMDQTSYNKALDASKNSGIKCEAFNLLFPGDTKLIGDDAKPDATAEYIKRLFPKLKAFGAEIVVFGSGGVRKCPEGFAYERAYEQLLQTGRILGEQAYDNGLTAVIEPLNKNESNMINTICDGKTLVERVGHPSFLLLADWYHCRQEEETGADVRFGGVYLRHTHIASPAGRINPAENDGGHYDDFFKALAEVGYDMRVSYEGSNINELDLFATDMLAYFKRLEKQQFQESRVKT